MADIKDRLQALDQLQPPDLWDRLPSDDGAWLDRPTARQGHRVAVVAVAITLTVVTTGFLLFAFRPGNQIASTDTKGWIAGSIPELGVSFRYPPQWHIQHVDESLDTAGFVATVITNTGDDYLHHPDQGPGNFASAWDLRSLAASAVVVSIESVQTIRGPATGPDTPLPLDLNHAQSLPLTRFAGGMSTLWLPFTINGHPVSARIHFGPDASATDREIAAEIVASITSSGPSVPPKVVRDTIVIEQGDADGRGRVTLSVPPTGSEAKALTADEALATFERADPSYQADRGATALLGLYNADPRFQDRLAWAFASSGNCPPPPLASGSSWSPSGECLTWLMLDAATGEQLETIVSYGGAGPTDAATPTNTATALDCPPSDQSIALLYPEPRLSSAPSPEGVVRQNLVGVLTTDDMSVTNVGEAGYDLDVRRGTAVIARIRITDIGGQWYAHTFASCISSGVRLPS